MKKIISIIAALALTASAFSCSEKKKEKPEKQPVTVEDGGSEPALDEPVKQDYMEFTEDSFKTVEVNLNITDRKPPITSYMLNMSELDFGECIPVCKTEDYRDKYKPDLSAETDEDYRRQIEEKWKSTCTEPTKGQIYETCLYGNNFYLCINYDTWCYGQHEESIFRVNGLTKEKEELFHYSDPENSLRIRQLYAINGVLYVYTEEKGLCWLDEEKSELVTILEPNNDIDSYGYIVSNSADRLIVSDVISDKKEVPDDYEPKSGEYISTYNDGKNYLILGHTTTMKEFDFDSKTWKELYSVYESTDESRSGTEKCPAIYGELFAWKEKPEGTRKYDVCTDYYRVSTGLTGCDILHADKKRLVVRLGSSEMNSLKAIVHVFDLEKSMHYIIDFGGIGANNCKYAYDGLITYSTGTGGCMYYIMPELGLTFPLAEFESDEFDSRLSDMMSFSDLYDNSVCFTISKRKGEHEVTHSDGNVTGTYYDYDDIRMWFTKEEGDE
ncbi:MAG: hypothetical protein K5898_05985 [Ruminococcus sp.]|uniref:hypothetical protein n=1 Tax=Ruminococcus sp. TaxID=41978 RepID=UPI0025F83D60|nr:hypothetical protein [Ruminococcus sp.]MCR4794706.1 hypothetical protein [Ruminococcus sp.]